MIGKAHGMLNVHVEYFAPEENPSVGWTLKQFVDNAALEEYAFKEMLVVLKEYDES